ncbi:MAG TPA: hypothetical protein VHA37_06900 [Candidatus Saccharimonadales bacterium]|nr:hypothetical protein [Candidatus Saccharimonadales bacterium]
MTNTKEQIAVQTLRDISKMHDITHILALAKKALEDIDAIDQLARDMPIGTSGGFTKG